MLVDVETPRRKPSTGRNSGHLSGSAPADASGAQSIAHGYHWRFCQASKLSIIYECCPCHTKMTTDIDPCEVLLMNDQAMLAVSSAYHTILHCNSQCPWIPAGCIPLVQAVGWHIRQAVSAVWFMAKLLKVRRSRGFFSLNISNCCRLGRGGDSEAGRGRSAVATDAARRGSLSKVERSHERQRGSRGALRSGLAAGALLALTPQGPTWGWPGRITAHAHGTRHRGSQGAGPGGPRGSCQLSSARM